LKVLGGGADKEKNFGRGERDPAIGERNETEEGTLRGSGEDGTPRDESCNLRRGNERLGKKR